MPYELQQCLPFTVLKLTYLLEQLDVFRFVATVLTVYGIETFFHKLFCSFKTIKLQQCLPFTVLKLFDHESFTLS